MWIIEGRGVHQKEFSVSLRQTLAERFDLIGAIAGTACDAAGWREAWGDASPVYHAPITSPATLLLYKTHDNLVSISHAESLQSRLSDCILIEPLHTSHSITASSDSTALQLFQAELNTLLGPLCE